MRSGCAYGRLFRSSAFTNEKIAVFAPTERASVSTTVRVRSEEHTLNSSHGYISYAVFCLKKKRRLFHRPCKRSYRLRRRHQPHQGKKPLLQRHKFHHKIRIRPNPLVISNRIQRRSPAPVG